MSGKRDKLHFILFSINLTFFDKIAIIHYENNIFSYKTKNKTTLFNPDLTQLIDHKHFQIASLFKRLIRV